MHVSLQSCQVRKATEAGCSGDQSEQIAQVNPQCFIFDTNQHQSLDSSISLYTGKASSKEASAATTEHSTAMGLASKLNSTLGAGGPGGVQLCSVQC